MLHSEPIDIGEPLILFSIRKSRRDGRCVYDAARFAWRVKIDNVKHERGYKLVPAHSEGRVVGAFRPTRWMEATGKNFPGKDLRIDPKDDLINCMPGRFGFEGKPAGDVSHRYLGKPVPDRFLGGQNPVRYCEPG